MTVDSDADIAPSFDAADAEEHAQRLVEHDFAELYLRLQVGAVGRLGERQRPLDDAAEGLRLADRHGEIAATKVGGECGATQIEAIEGDAGGRNPQIDVEPIQHVEFKRHAVPIPIRSQEAEGGDI